MLLIFAMNNLFEKLKSNFFVSEFRAHTFKSVCAVYKLGILTTDILGPNDLKRSHNMNFQTCCLDMSGGFAGVHVLNVCRNSTSYTSTNTTKTLWFSLFSQFQFENIF